MKKLIITLMAMLCLSCSNVERDEAYFYTTMIDTRSQTIFRAESIFYVDDSIHLESQNSYRVFGLKKTTKHQNCVSYLSNEGLVFTLYPSELYISIKGNVLYLLK